MYEARWIHDHRITSRIIGFTFSFGDPIVFAIFTGTVSHVYVFVHYNCICVSDGQVNWGIYLETQFNNYCINTEMLN